jgi:uncharacterized protein (UPF0548 family)
VAEWRFGWGWSDEELAARLAALEGSERNFDPDEPKTPETGWLRHSSETAIARERAGPPEPAGAFVRARAAVERYEFSDPRIVTAHFEPRGPLAGRRLLLEMKALGFRFLAGVVVAAVREEQSDDQTTFGFRYDTLAGHIEAGWEWFLLTKSHATGEVRFRIAADWQPGDFPNRWSRIGFGVLGRRYQRRWSARAHARLRHIVESDRPVPAGSPLLHQGPEDVRSQEEGTG